MGTAAWCGELEIHREIRVILGFISSGYSSLVWGTVDPEERSEWYWGLSAVGTAAWCGELEIPREIRVILGFISSGYSSLVWGTGETQRDQSDTGVYQQWVQQPGVGNWRYPERSEWYWGLSSVGTAAWCGKLEIPREIRLILGFIISGYNSLVCRTGDSQRDQSDTRVYHQWVQQPGVGNWRPPERSEWY